MNKTKCAGCGLVNFAEAAVCKRCGKALGKAPPAFERKPETGEDFTNENRQIAFGALAFGVFCSIAPWVLTFKLQFNYGKLNAIMVVFGLSMIVAGLGILFDTPKTKLNAEENKGRNGVLILVGLILGLGEAFFFNKALGLW